MAKAPKPQEPETKFYRLVQRKGGFAIEVALVQGERVLATDQGDMDTYASTAGQMLTMASKDVGL